MRIGLLGKWIAVLWAAWLVTGCAAVTPRPGPVGTVGHGSRAPARRVLHQGSGSASPVRMPVGTVVSSATPGELAVLAVETGMREVDAFERLLVYAGLDATDELPQRINPFTTEEATRLLVLLLSKPVTLGNFPPRMGASYLLREVLERGEVSREELLRRVERFTGVAVLRPDGYLAWVRNGRTQQRVAPVEWRDGAFRAGPFELGRFYNGRSGVFRQVDERLQPVVNSFVVEVYDDADVISRTLDGAEGAFVELYHAMGQLLSHPVDSMAALRHLPAGVAALIASSPEYWERFRYMTAGEQMKAVSKLVTTLHATWGAAAGTTRTIAGGLAGAEATVPVLSLSAQGALVLERIAVPVGRAATVLSGGPGAAIVLHRANTAGGGASSSDWPGRWEPAKEHMEEPARRYEKQVTGAPEGQVYKVEDVKFDGFKEGVLLEAKGPGYAEHILDAAENKGWFQGFREMVKQAKRQQRVANGYPIQWHFAEREAADFVRALFVRNDLGDISVIFTPAR